MIQSGSLQIPNQRYQPEKTYPSSADERWGCGAPGKHNQPKQYAAYHGEKLLKGVDEIATHQLSMTLRKQKAVLEVVEPNHQCVECRGPPT